MENKKIDFCMICKKKFDDVVTKSKEHIISEAFGNTKLVTFGVCKKYNNDLGRIIDSYLVKDNILSRFIRKTELEKDKNIGLFDKKIKTITGDDGREYLIKKNNGFKLKPIIDIKENGKIRVSASNLKECKEILTTILHQKEEFNFLNVRDIENIINNPVSINEYNDSVEVGYSEEINLGKIYLAIIKIAYEYAVEKLGISYIENNFADKIRNYLYKAITTKTDINYDFCYKVCSYVDFNFFDYNNIIEMCKNIVSVENFELSNIRHFICLVNFYEKVFCMMRLFNNDFLTFKILLSDNMIFQNNKKFFISFIMNNNEIVEF